MAEKMVEDNDLESNGIYIAVGTYDHQELVAMAIHALERDWIAS